MVSSPGGIQMGHLLYAADKFVQKHRLCPDGPLHMLNGNGYVNLSIKFTGYVQVRSDDPVIPRLPPFWMPDPKALENQALLFNDQYQRQMKHLEDYTRAKRDARNAGTPIPTLTEYEASLRAAESGDEDIMPIVRLPPKSQP